MFSALAYLFLFLSPFIYMLGKLSFMANFQEVQTVAKEAAETVVLVIDEEGIESLLSELLKGVADSQVHCQKKKIHSF